METKSSGRVKHSASFRDPSGFLFWRGGILYRQINKVFAKNYDLLMRSGLYKELVEKKLLIPHKEVRMRGAGEDVYKIIQPEPIKFISYPYEWSFGQLKDAALLTLNVQKMALGFGMSLRDASAYNVQFHNGRLIFIDTLSFEKYEEGRPWVAYGQFCGHFLAPLALMAHIDVRFSELLRVYLDGIPLDLASKLLPWKTGFAPSLALHVHLHAKIQKRHRAARDNALKSDLSQAEPRRGVDKTGILGIVESLEGAISKLDWRPTGTGWAEYYDFTNYSEAAFEAKKGLVAEFIAKAKPATVWDLGANDGLFSRLASDKGIFTISADVDPAAVEKNYRTLKERGEKDLLPLLIDLTNPSPAVGWGNEERTSFKERGPADLVMALALVHHLAITNNLPFENIAKYFAELGRFLIIEFVPKEDSQAQKLLQNRDDIFVNYRQNVFEREFGRLFSIQNKEEIRGSKRTLYLMRRRAPRF